MHVFGPTPSPSLEALRKELQGPVDGVLAMAALLARSGLGEDADACLRSLQDSAQQAARTLELVATLEQARSGALALAAEPFAVRSLVDELQVRAAADGGAALLASYEGDGELGAVGDADRLALVLDGLTGVAAQRRRRAPVEVALSAHAAFGRVRLRGRVRDDGACGEGERLEDLLGLERGGVGAALAAALIRLMGGRLMVEGNAGAGVTFAFELQLEEARVEAPAAQPDAPEGLLGRHVLIVDDNATNRLVAEAFCDMFGCTSDSVGDGVEAVEAVRVRRYDAVLMDVKMPRMDGVEATRAIAGLPGPAGRTPIIALTANADPEDVVRYRAAGMVDVVEKPIKAERLAAALDAVFDEQLADQTRAA